MEWQGKFPSAARRNTDIGIRTMQFQDLTEVERIDRTAFPSLWQNSPAGLSKAFSQPGISTVAVKEGKIVGYQISTSMTIYGHLARLAVDPDCQRQGIAFALVYDLLKQFEHRGFWRVTVNTQSDNRASLKLYKKFGFRRTSEEIKVYSLDL
jgi:ribosomal protein S18 acetylase RimI-like enzyme